MTPRETVDLLQRLTPSRGPLPPQRWGFLPTEQFWRLAARTPIFFGLWFIAGFFYDWLCSFGLPWWQNGLGCLVFTAVWAGLVERWSRQYFIRRRMRALSSPECPFEEAPSELVPAQEPQRGLPIVATSEFWDYAYEKLFGRGKTVAYVVFNAMFFMVAFFPSWQVLVGSFLVMVAMSLGLGWWQRRLIRSQFEGAQAGPVLAGSSMPGLQSGDDR
ncbi:hypothetical protein [Nannocystis radixulma]|uniref:Uncharacterized protein n=1 Tax=Nannocystis radixulma TaxID=2995305 RepID=A0ABT5B5C8_9BACT|nr:hypothetical protein [Nannocystis radixulma]MDC0669334.1 hypothetical protein [Nannocystis radixulma]